MNNCQEIHFWFVPFSLRVFIWKIFKNKIRENSSLLFLGRSGTTPEKPRFYGTTRYPPLVAISLSPPFLIILTFGGLGAVIR